MTYEMNIAEIRQCYDDGLTTAGQCANQLVDEVMTGESNNLRAYKVTCAYLSKKLSAKEYINHFEGGHCMKRGSTVQYLYKRPSSNKSNVGVITVKAKHRVIVRFEDGTLLARKSDSFRLLGHNNGITNSV